MEFKKSYPSKKVDIALVNGKIATVDKNFSVQQAVAIKNDRIVSVGTNKQIENLVEENTRVIDLEGKTVLPGINDTHIHAALFGGTRPPLSLDVGYPEVGSIKDIRSLVAHKVATLEPGEWIIGFGWDENRLKECSDDKSRHPSKLDLDSVSPDNPICFTDLQMHIVWANSKALELSGITKNTVLPSGGVIEKDANSGEPTGLLMELPAMGLVMKKIPPWNREQKRVAILSAMKELNALGVTSITEPALGPGGEGYQGGLMDSECISVYNDLYNENLLTTRVNILLLFGRYGALSFEDIEKSLSVIGFHSGFGNEWFKLGGIKVFGDGIPPAKTAWMSKPYLGGEYGSLVFPGKTDEERCRELSRIVSYAHKHRFQIGIHSCGDRTIDACADAFIKALKKDPWDARHYMIHGDFISDETIERIAGNSIGVNIQPEVHTVISDSLQEIMDKNLVSRQFPTRTMIDAGIHVAASTDGPCMYPDWKDTIQSAVLRKSKISGKVFGPEQRISVSEAIRMFTIEAAWFDNLENQKGSIEYGKLADMCILDKDILDIDPHRIQEIKNTMTIVGGKIVFDAF
jgi:predicted amidohydrolase YtcJ